MPQSDLAPDGFEMVPIRRNGAPCKRWCPSSARRTYQPVRPPRDAWLDAHGLRVCLACREISPQGEWFPGPRCSTAVPAALALAQGKAGTIPAVLDLVHLLGTRFLTLRRVPIAACSTWARALLLPPAGLGAGNDMGDPDAPSPLPPHHPRGTRTGRRGDEVLDDPAMPAQLPGGSNGPIGGTGCPHPPAGDDRWPPDAGPK